MVPILQVMVDVYLLLVCMNCKFEGSWRFYGAATVLMQAPAAVMEGTNKPADSAEANIKR